MSMISGVNDIAGRTVYPSSYGQSLGVRGSATSAPVSAVSTTGAKAARAPSEPEQAAAVGSAGNPLVWWGVLFIMLLGLMFMAKRLGSESEFASIKPSVYNVLVISFAAIIGINFWKVVFTKLKVPGLSSVVLAA